jgi:hypothetical protein
MPRCGVNEYSAVYETKFVDNLRRYAAMRQRIKQRLDRLLDDPYHNTETLVDASAN